MKQIELTPEQAAKLAREQRRQDTAANKPRYIPPAERNQSFGEAKPVPPAKPART